MIRGIKTVKKKSMIGLITNPSIIITDLLFKFFLQNDLIHLKIKSVIGRKILV